MRQSMSADHLSQVTEVTGDLFKVTELIKHDTPLSAVSLAE